MRITKIEVEAMYGWAAMRREGVEIVIEVESRGSEHEWADSHRVAAHDCAAQMEVARLVQQSMDGYRGEDEEEVAEYARVMAILVGR